MTNAKKDQELIALLRANARMPVSELARKMNVSRTAAQARLQRLEREGTVTGYTVRLSDEFMQNCIKAIIMIKVPSDKRAPVERALNSLPELMTLYSISGMFDMTAIVRARSIPELDQVIDHIGVMDGVAETQSSIILATKIER